MIALTLTLLAGVTLLTLLGLAVRDAFRQAATLGWTRQDDAELRRVAGSGVESLG